MDCKTSQVGCYYFQVMPSPDGLSPEEFDPRPHLARLLPGCVLLARDLQDPNFSRSVVLLCQHGPEGSYGLVLNRPARMPLSEIFDLSDLGEQKPNHLQKVYIGGPVQPEELQVLQVAEADVSGAVAVAPAVHVGGHFANLSDILAADPMHLRLFLGYSGWGAEQLEKEVVWGAWEVWPGDVRKLLQIPEEQLMQGGEAVRAFLADP